MAIKIFRPRVKRTKLIKVQSPINQQGTSTGITIIPTGTAPGNTTLPGTGGWMSVPVSRNLYNFGSSSIPVIDLDIDVKETRDGLDCTKCKEFYPYATPNQEDGKTLICFACRNGY